MAACEFLRRFINDDFYLQEQDAFNVFIDRMNDETKFPHGYANKRIVSKTVTKDLSLKQENYKNTNEKPNGGITHG